MSEWLPIDSAPRVGYFVVLIEYKSEFGFKQETVYEYDIAKFKSGSIEGETFSFTKDEIVGWLPLPPKP